MLEVEFFEKLHPETPCYFCGDPSAGLIKIHGKELFLCIACFSLLEKELSEKTRKWEKENLLIEEE
ncbi:MAG: hypothetical protein ACTSV7_09070 [Candidatus Baldrarchaeia archaeon]